MTTENHSRAQESLDNDHITRSLVCAIMSCAGSLDEIASGISAIGAIMSLKEYQKKKKRNLMVKKAKL